jgi:hypothetical protein
MSTFECPPRSDANSVHVGEFDARAVAVLPADDMKGVHTVIVTQCNRPVSVFTRGLKVAAKDQ